MPFVSKLFNKATKIYSEDAIEIEVYNSTWDTLKTNLRKELNFLACRRVVQRKDKSFMYVPQIQMKNNAANSHSHTSHVTRETVFGVRDQVRLKPACSAIETS